MRPPGAATGTTSQAGAAVTGAGFFFKAAIAAYKTALIVIWQSGAGVHTTWR
jgi:hypothetical protein